MQEVSSSHRRARLFRDGSGQALHIPREYELASDEVLLYKEGDRLIVEPWPAPSGLLRLLERLEPIEEAFPDVDTGLLSAEDVRL
jgi:antitoxin VapB